MTDRNPEARSTSWLWSLAAWLLLPLLFMGYVGLEIGLSSRVDPSGRFTDLPGYLAYRPGADRFDSVVIAGAPYVVAYRRDNGVVPSGPAVYVFDSTGKLVDWSSDIGDEKPAFLARWEVDRWPTAGTALTRAEVQRQIDAATSRPANP